MKIDFRQTKYLLPAVMFIPGVLVLYLVMDLFGVTGGDSDAQIAQETHELNPSLPDANARDVDDKFTEMSRRYANKDFGSWSGIAGFEDVPEKSTPELAEIIETEETEETIGTNPAGPAMTYDTSEQGSWSEDVDMQRLEEALERSRKALAGMDDGEYEETPEEMEARIRKEVEAEAEARYAALQPIQGAPEPLPAPEVGEEKIEIVEKAEASGSGQFNTISSDATQADNALIKAMIDATTKAQDGTRIRFKLLDDVVVSGNEIKKGSYLFGTVVGFGTQRVKVEVSSILINGKFIKVKLSAYDVDGMEGFYVPASAFREFMRDAASKTASTNLQINNGGYGNRISGEMLALQALQNVYNAASSAASGQIRKNKAKIKYNTVVYLINSDSI